MGHQVAFIYFNKSNLESNHRSIEQLLEMFRKYNVRCEDDPENTCYSRLTLNKSFDGFRKGSELLLLEGERSRVRSAARVFNQDFTAEEAEKWGIIRPALTRAEENLIYNRMKIVFWEWFPWLTEEAIQDGTITEEELHLKSAI